MSWSQSSSQLRLDDRMAPVRLANRRKYVLFFVCRTDDGVDVELYDLPPGTFIQSAIAPAAIEVGSSAPVTESSRNSELANIGTVCARARCGPMRPSLDVTSPRAA